MNSKETSVKACKIRLKLGLHGNFSNPANMGRPCCHVWKVAISFSNLNFSYIEHVTTHYQTLQTRIGLYVTCYHSFSYHMRYRIFSLRFSWFWTICNALPRVTIIFFKKNINIYFFINFTVMRCSALEIAPNHAKLRVNVL